MKDTAFILDFNLLKEQCLSIDEYLVLIHLKDDIIYNNSESVLSSLQEKQFIKTLTKEKVILREKGKIFLELISIENIDSLSNKKVIKKSSRSINSDLDVLVKEYRSLWRGLKPGSMGHEQGVRDKLYRWMQNNPTYSKEDIIKSAKLYIQSLDNYNYLQQADYFIYKKDLNGESSRLSAFIDESEISVDENWTNNLI